MYRSARIVSFHTAFALIVTAGTALAGPLNPPAGPITSTYKTLTEVEPRTPISTAGFTITQPGSYYLTRNLLPVAQRGVVIQADNVTLDLNGFAIDGAGVSDDGILVGFAAFGGQKNVVIKNGTIRNTVKEGIDAFGNSNVRIENITVDTAIDGFGIIVGDFAVVSNCVIRGTGAGVLAGNNSVISDCVADGSTGEVGIGAGENSTVRNCVSSNGKRGFRVGANSVIEACTAASNTGTGPEDGIGFLVGAFSRVINCTARNNSGTAATGGTGFRLGEGGSLTGCTATSNTPDGFNIGPNSVVIGCNANRNASVGFVLQGSTVLTDSSSSSNSSHGLNLLGSSSGSTVRNCTILNNGGVGVRVDGLSAGNVIDANCVRGSSLEGIEVLGATNTISNNMIDFNARAAGNQASISLIGNNNIADGNFITSGEFGIRTVGPLNVVRRNTSSFNPAGSYQFGANTIFGPLVNATAGGDLSALVNGTHPAANIFK